MAIPADVAEPTDAVVCSVVAQIDAEILGRSPLPGDQIRFSVDSSILPHVRRMYRLRGWRAAYDEGQLMLAPTRAGELRPEHQEFYDSVTRRLDDLLGQRGYAHVVPQVPEAVLHRIEFDYLRAGWDVHVSGSSVQVNGRL